MLWARSRSSVCEKDNPHSVPPGEGYGTWSCWLHPGHGDLLTPFIAGTSPVSEQRPHLAGSSTTSSILTSLRLDECPLAFPLQEERAPMAQESFVCNIAVIAMLQNSLQLFLLCVA